MSESEEYSLTCILYVILIAIIMIIVGSILRVYVFEFLGLGIMGFGGIILVCLICGFIQGTCKVASKPKSLKKKYKPPSRYKSKPIEQRERKERETKEEELLKNFDRYSRERKAGKEIPFSGDFILEEANRIGKKLKRETIEKVESMLKVSDRLRLSMVRKTLKMEEDVYIAKIIDLAEEMGLKIDGDFLVINQDTVQDFIDTLDKQYESWEKMEKEKNGKI